MQPSVSTTNVVSTNPQNENEQDKMLVFRDARVHLERIIQDWREEVEDTEVRRKTRKVEIDIEALRQKQEVDEDETFIPVRLIDNNIIREQPPYINYLKNSRRLAVFECLSNPEFDVDLIEQAFTKVSTYTSWETPYFKCLDGSQAHGWDAIEVVFDSNKPGNFALEHIGHDKLFFPRSSIDIQQSPRIIRCYDVTILQLQDWVINYSFDSEQVENIRKTRRETQKENETVRLYKLFFKKDKVVFVAWFTITDGVTDWLKQPTELYIGVDEQTGNGFVPKPITQYPIFILPYREMEEAQITAHKGRVFLDEAKQEAQTALWSSFVNGMNRASNLYASPAQEDGSGASLKELEDVILRGGRVMSKPINFWSPPYPDPVVLRTLQFADVSNDNESGNVNFAAINREDSRKTAKEIGAAQNQQSLLNSVQLTLFSTFIRQIVNFTWLIVQSQALQNKIAFLQVKTQQPKINPIIGIPIVNPQTGQPEVEEVWVNDTKSISLLFSLRAAGDVDVIQKQELEAKMQQDWPVIASTPLASVFMTDYVKLRYPDKGDRYALALQNTDQMNALKGMVGRLSTILEGAIKQHPEMLDTISPQEKSQVAQLLQESKQVTGV